MKLSQTAIPAMNCPTRRGTGGGGTVLFQYYYSDVYHNMQTPKVIVRGDYGACMGGRLRPVDGLAEPRSLAMAKIVDWTPSEKTTRLRGSLGRSV